MSNRRRRRQKQADTRRIALLPEPVVFRISMVVPSDPERLKAVTDGLGISDKFIVVLDKHEDRPDYGPRFDLLHILGKSDLPLIDERSTIKLCQIDVFAEEAQDKTSLSKVPFTPDLDLHDDDEDENEQPSLILLHVGGIFTESVEFDGSDEFMDKFNAAVEQAQKLEPITINEFINFLSLHFTICEGIHSDMGDEGFDSKLFVSVIESLLPIGVRIQRRMKEYFKNRKRNIEYNERWKNLFIEAGQHNAKAKPKANAKASTDTQSNESAE